MSNALTTATPLSLLQVAIDKNLDTDKLEKLMQLQERWQANEAKVAFSEAMAACQADMPAIIKDSTNTQTGSDYASFEAINRLIKPVYTKHGFSLSFGEESATDKGVTSYCECRHASGHVERTRLFLPLDGVGLAGKKSMTDIHAKVSTMTYARRTLTKLVFAIAEAGDDQDGNLPQGTITEEQGAQLATLIKEKNVDYDAFFGWAAEAAKTPISRLGEIPAALFGKCVDRLKKARRAG